MGVSKNVTRMICTTRDQLKTLTVVLNKHVERQRNFLTEDVMEGNIIGEKQSIF